MDLTKILNRSIQIYLVTLVQNKTDYLRSLFRDMIKILNRSIQIYLVTIIQLIPLPTFSHIHNSRTHSTLSCVVFLK